MDRTHSLHDIILIFITILQCELTVLLGLFAGGEKHVQCTNFLTSISACVVFMNKYVEAFSQKIIYLFLLLENFLSFCLYCLCQCACSSAEITPIFCNVIVPVCNASF
jgi:hypothetical protein